MKTKKPKTHERVAKRAKHIGIVVCLEQQGNPFTGMTTRVTIEYGGLGMSDVKMLPLDVVEIVKVDK